MSLKVKSTLIRVLIILGVQAPFWWLKDLATLIWPELAAGGALDLLVGISCGMGALFASIVVMNRLLEPVLIPEVRDES